LRRRELATVLRAAVQRACNTVLLDAAPVVMAAGSFAAAAASGRELSSADVFAAVSLFNILRSPLQYIPKVCAERAALSFTVCALCLI
jgi:hypothetical protein